MRVFIWSDMEGVAGITNWEQVGGGRPLYEEGRRLYTDEINACVRGCKRAGATEIIVVDGHGAGGGWTMNSFNKDRLEPGAEYVNGHRWGCYVEPFKAGIDCMLLPGAHAMAGTEDGVLSHTMSSESWFEATINGTPVGESGIVAAIAGTFDVPCVFASGDEATIEEVQSLLGKSVVGAVVKKGLGRFAARSLAPADACSLIEEQTCQALKNRDKWPKPFKVTAPVEFKVIMHTSDKTREYIGRTGVEIVPPRTVISRADTFWQAWDQFWRQS